jgi:hypothetical protein
LYDGVNGVVKSAAIDTLLISTDMVVVCTHWCMTQANVNIEPAASIISIVLQHAHGDEDGLYVAHSESQPVIEDLSYVGGEGLVFVLQIRRSQTRRFLRWKLLTTSIEGSDDAQSFLFSAGLAAPAEEARIST